VFRHIMSGGGGYGDPLEREPGLVLEDIITEKVTPKHARREYGVVIDLSGMVPAIDATATETLRGEMRKGL
jgi:N-methylhydantoinase B